MFVGGRSGVLPALSANARWRIWMWRFGVWFASWITEMLHFKAHVPLTQTMAWFGVIAYLWVKNEIAWSKRMRHREYWLGRGCGAIRCIWCMRRQRSLVLAEHTTVGPRLILVRRDFEQPGRSVRVLFGGGAAVASIGAMDWIDEIDGDS